MIGDDPAGRDLCRLLQKAGIETEGLYVDGSRPTSTKTRIIGGSAQQVHQQVARIDNVDASEIDGVAKRSLAAFLTHQLPESHALLISDYEAGVINPALIETVLPLAREQGIITTVNSHGDLLRFKHVTVATPNEPEAAASANRHVHSTEDLLRCWEGSARGHGRSGYSDHAGQRRHGSVRTEWRRPRPTGGRAQ